MSETEKRQRQRNRDPNKNFENRLLKKADSMNIKRSIPEIPIQAKTLLHYINAI